MNSRNNQTKRNTARSGQRTGTASSTRYSSHVSGTRRNGSVVRRQGVEFSQRRQSPPGAYSTRRTEYSRSMPESGRVERKAEATSRRSRTASGINKSRSAQGSSRSRQRRSTQYPARQRQHVSSGAAAKSAAYYRRKKRRKQQLRVRFAILLAVVVFLLFLVCQIFPVVPSAEVEAGTVVNARDLLRFPFMTASFPKGSIKYNKNKPGTYEILVHSGIFNHKCTLTVVDTEPPVLELQDYSTGIGGGCSPKDFIKSLSDNSKTTVNFVNEPDQTRVGETQEVTLVARDAAGNETVKTANYTILPIATLVRVEIGTEKPTIDSFMANADEPDEENYMVTDLDAIDYMTPGEYEVKFVWHGKEYSAKMIVEDTTAPVFDLAEDFTTYLGESIRYKEHVSVVDNSGQYELTIDNSQVDTEQLGTYDVIYTATDPYGNSSTVTVKMTIAEKTADEALLFEKVDAILAQILTDGMTEKEKVYAIYHYANGNFMFVNDSEKGDYVKAALTMLEIRQGDCYSYFALSKALLTRAGIKNVDIYTLNETSEHYWNLIEIDDGHGWYHYDSTPTVIPMEIVFYTEADLKPINDGRYDYDHSKFPKVS